MSSFHQGSWASRFASMGDEAEASFEQLFPKFHRSGLNRPPFNMSALTLQQKNTPDYLTETGYCEVMGMGRDSTLKLKHEKAVALTMWSASNNVDLFVWDSHRRRWWRGPWLQWFEACANHAETNTFPESPKPVYFLKAKNFPFTPAKVAEAA